MISVIAAIAVIAVNVVIVVIAAIVVNSVIAVNAVNADIAVIAANTVAAVIVNFKHIKTTAVYKNQTNLISKSARSYFLIRTTIE